MTSDVRQDLRYGARLLLKKPGFRLIVVISLALGIASDTWTIGAAYATPRGGAPQTAIAITELQARRRAAIERCPDGIILLHANSGMKRWDEAYFQQDTNFYYFTGLRNAQSAILAIDGIAKETWLFVPPARGTFGSDLKGLNRAYLSPGSVTEAELGVEHVVPWDQFLSFLDARKARDPKAVLYVDSAGQTGGQAGDRANPAGLRGVNNIHLLWLDAIRAQWPDLQVRDAWPPLTEVRAVKSPAEVDALRKAAAVTEAGFWAGVRVIAPGKTQRQVEGAVIQGCLEAGSDGPSLWPWVQSGPNAPPLFEGFVDYGNLNRTLQAGGLIRFDLGCDFNMYKGDFGRTIPVSGHFDEGQRETLDLLTNAYLAAVKTMKHGTTNDDLVKAATANIQEKLSRLRTPMARQAAADMLKNPRRFTTLHGLGLDMADGDVKVMHAGNVICYEPAVTVEGHAFFVEDTFLITKDGYEVLNPPLPYTAAEIEKAIAKAVSGSRKK